MRVAMLTLVCVAIGGCISGAPRLTLEQTGRLDQISAYKPGEAPPRDYREISRISSADCSSDAGGGRLSGSSAAAINTLRAKAAALNADAVLNVTCGAVPLLNNCWAAQKCTGTAVVFQ